MWKKQGVDCNWYCQHFSWIPWVPFRGAPSQQGMFIPSMTTLYHTSLDDYARAAWAILFACAHSCKYLGVYVVFMQILANDCDIQEYDSPAPLP